MGNTCKPMADSFQCMTKPTTIKKKKKKNISRYLEKNQKGLAIILMRQNLFFLLKKGVTAGEFLRILWMVI